jgi:hypothetical protein
MGERGEASDMAVRLTAAVSIKEGVDVSQGGRWADDSCGISTLDTLSRIWNRRLQNCEYKRSEKLNFRVKLLGEASTLSGKRYLNETLLVVIDRVQEKVSVVQLWPS